MDAIFPLIAREASENRIADVGWWRHELEWLETAFVKLHKWVEAASGPPANHVARP